MFGRTVLPWLLAASVALGGVARAASAPQCAPVTAVGESFGRGLFAALEDPDDEVVAVALLKLDGVLGCLPESRERLQAFLRTPRAARASGAGGGLLLLARLLEPERALELQEFLVERAAETRDHTVSDEFVNLFKARRRVEQARDLSQEPPGSSAPTT